MVVTRADGTGVRSMFAALSVATGRVPAVTAELDRIAFHLADITAELTERSPLFDGAFARGVRTLCCHGDLHFPVPF
jgi:hypothetical protein